MIRAGDDEFIAQVEHEHVGVAFVQRAMKGRVGLGREDHGGARLANDPRRAVVREGAFRTRDDLLSLVREKDDEIGLIPFFRLFIESAQGMEVIREFQDRVDVKPLRLELLRHGDTDDFPGVDLTNRKGRLVCAEDFRDFRVDEEFEIGAERSLHAAELFGRLAEKAVAKGDDQFVRTLVPLVHQRFNGRVRVRLIEQKPVDVRNRDIRLHVPEDFKPGLNRDLRLRREKRILPAATGQRDGGIHDDFGIRRSRNVWIARDIDRVDGPPQFIFS